MVENSSILSTAILFMFILDPFGNVPLLLSILKNVDEKRKKIIIMRESLFGLVVLLFFFFFGKSFLSIFHLETAAVTIAGAIIFFVIALKMIFPGDNGNSTLFGANEEPFVVPIAIPMIAGPSALATLLLMTKTHAAMSSSKLLLAVLLAWFISSCILYVSPFLYKILRRKGLNALEKLMGMLLLMMAVQMFIDGIRNLFHLPF
ncbi:MarC family protein [Sulfurospirillum sp. 1612]|uniref:MarC family protein n=1 Tax=Sulfurospirillum sp. 1612 TaxID=3094835 RepID=UPI002F92E65D